MAASAENSVRAHGDAASCSGLEESELPQRSLTTHASLNSCAESVACPAANAACDSGEVSHDNPGAVTWSDGTDSWASSELQQVRAGSHQSSATVRSSGDSSILKGLRLSLALAWFGWVWRSRPQNSCQSTRLRLHALSEPVAVIDVFVSHAWASPGWSKYVALIGRYRKRRLLYSMAVVFFALLFLRIEGLLPTIGNYVTAFDFLGKEAFEIHLEIIGACVAPAVGILVLLLTSAISGVGAKEPFLFLDQACINQDNDQLKRQGIAGLPYFLRKSKSLLILWTPQYFSRLWCVFELAAYMHVHRGNVSFTVDVCAVYAEVTLLRLFFAYWIASLSFLLAMVVFSGSQGKLLASMICAELISSTSFLFVARKVIVEQQQLDDLIRTFDCSEAQCTSADDKEMLLNKIELWHGSREVFNDIVRQQLGQQLRAGAARGEGTLSGHMTYQNALATTFPLLSAQLSILGGYVAAGVEADEIASWIIFSAISASLVQPAFCKLLCYLAERYAQSSTSVMSILVPALLYSLPSCAARYVGAIASKLHLAANVVPLICCIAVVVRCFRTQKWSQVQAA
eukprot:gb/GFBE01035227.1/.p1 GENE.gb/GFBE01035227.1/~~gb/GFBE01035227.1/.p1  ORF type:complete len:571 (+),score=99.62 gb/GFBE01035227.1/:1-1713(+)